jgi:hypothetical protein
MARLKKVKQSDQSRSHVPREEKHHAERDDYTAPSLRDDLQQVFKMAGVVATILSVLSLGLPAILAWITEHLGPAIPIWKAFATTAPLTVAVAAIGVGLIRGWLDGPGRFLFACAGTLILTAGIGHAVGMGGWIDLAARWRDLPSGIYQLPIAVMTLFLENYWRLYGPQMFASSFVVGAFLAWAWGVKLLPHLDRMSSGSTSATRPAPPSKRSAA